MTIKGSVAFFSPHQEDFIHVPLNHVSTVIADPERFGLTLREIEAAYDRHGERIGVEGEARKELLFRIITDGWIRIRRHRNYWSVNAPSPSPAISESLQGWAARALEGIDGFREPDRYMPVKVSTSEGESLCTIKDLAEGSCPWQEGLPTTFPDKKSPVS